MKKIFIILVLFLAFNLNLNAQGNYKRSGNTFTQVDQKKATQGTKATKTGLIWETSGGDKYDIYLSKNGRAFILRTSKKTGNTYKQYLGPEVSKEICKEKNVKYVEK